MLLWQIYVAGNNKAYLGFCVSCLTFVSDLHQIWRFATDFSVDPCVGRRT